MSSNCKKTAFTVIVPDDQGPLAPEPSELGQEERRLLMAITGPQPRLDYPTHQLVNSLGKGIEVYDIPQHEREDVLEQLYPFPGTPSLDTELFDIHERKTFIVKDFMVTREGEGNFLVSPYYLRSGGTVLDWLELPEDGSLDSLLGQGFSFGFDCLNKPHGKNA